MTCTASWALITNPLPVGVTVRMTVGGTGGVALGLTILVTAGVTVGVQQKHNGYLAGKGLEECSGADNAVSDALG